MADNELNVTIRGRDELTPQLKGLESGLIRFVGFVSSAFATVKLAAFPISQAADFQREMANVTKTTNFSAQQIQNLGDQLGQLSLRTNTSSVDLAKIAAAAGQQGLGKEGVEGILRFTDSVSRMASVLDLTAQDAATSLGKILNIFQIPLTKIENVSSAINQVSNNSTAKATELINVLKRLGDAGGSLKFTQSLALSATAIDLGATPEVAGTTLSKFVNALKVRNDDFARLLGKTREQLAQDTKADAFQVFVETMQKLSEVKLVDREKAITKLFGGGRITSLADKFLIDIVKQNSILQKNLNNSIGGEESGTSSKREQATVLATLTEQTVILKNSFKELGRAAGEDLLVPLSGYVAQLRLALQTPQLKSFAAAVVSSLKDLVETVVGATKFLASLNINWENFLKVAKLLVELKLAKVFLGLVTQIPGVTGLMNLLSGASTRAGAAAAGAGAAGEQAAKKQQTALQALQAEIAKTSAAYRTAQAARMAGAEAEAAAQAAQAAERAAVERANLLGQDANAKIRQAKTANSALSTAVAVRDVTAFRGGNQVDAANATGNTAIAAAQQVGRVKAEEAELAHQTRVTAIREQYAGVRTKVAKAERDTLLAQEEAFYVRQTAALRVQDGKRIAAAETNAAQLVSVTAARAARELEIEEAKVIAQQRIASGAASAANAAGAAATGAIAGAGVATAAAAAARSTAAVAPGLITAATASLFSFSRMLTLVGVGLRFVLSALGPIYLGFVIITSILDHFGLLNDLPKFFNKLTDAMGFTTEATRKLAQATKDAEATRAKEKKDLDDLLERYEKLKDAKSGLLDKKELGKVTDGLKGATSDADVTTALKNLALPIQGSQAESKKLQEAITTSPAQYKDAIAELAGLKAKLAETQSAIDTYDQRLAVLRAANAGVGIGIGEAEKRALQETAQNIQASIDDATKRAQAFGPEVVASLNTAAPLISAAGKDINKIIQGMFLPETSTFFDKVAPGILAAKQKIADLEAKVPEGGVKIGSEIGKLEQAKNDVATATTAEAKKAAAARVASVENEISAQKAIIISTLDAIRKKLDEFKGDKTLSDIFKVAAGNVLNFLGAELPDLKAFVSQKAIASAEGKFTGELINPNQNKEKPATRAFTAGNTSGEESEARKRAKALAAIERARLVAAAELQKQFNDSFLQEDQRKYDNGILSLRDYYDDKDAIDRSNLANDIKLKADEIAAKRREQQNPAFKQSDKLKIDAEIATLEGQRQVLIDKLQQIPKQTAEALQKAARELNESVLAEKLDIIRILGIDDYPAQLDLQLSLLESQLKIRIAKLETELKAGTPGVTRAFIDNFRIVGLLKAIDPVLQSIADKANVTAGAIQNVFSRISFAQSQGKLTDREAERLINDARAAEAVAVDAQIAQIESVRSATIAQIKSRTDLGDAEKNVAEATIKSSTEYKKQENELDALKQKYDELNVVIDQTATNLNKSLESSLGKSLQSIMEGTTGGLKKFIKSFAADFGGAINQVVSKDLAQDFIKKFLGGGGSGGVGGFFSKLLNPNGVGGKAARLADKETLGRSEATPMYVKVTNQSDKPGQGDGTGGDKQNDPFGNVPTDPNAGSGTGDILDLGSVGDEAAKAAEEAQKANEAIFQSSSDIFGDGGLGDTISSGLEGVKTDFLDGFSVLSAPETNGLSSLFSSLTSTFSDIFGSLGSSLSGLGSSLSSMISSIFGGAGGGGEASAFADIAMAFFHTGGVVGEGAHMGRVNPMVFAGAMRYHTGGIAGLQPDEVPSILRRGEEVLTQDNPRHRDNGGGQRPMTVTMTINTPDANSFRKSQDQIAAEAGQVANRALRRNR